MLAPILRRHAAYHRATPLLITHSQTTAGMGGKASIIYNGRLRYILEVALITWLDRLSLDPPPRDNVCQDSRDIVACIHFSHQQLVPVIPQNNIPHSQGDRVQIMLASFNNK